MKSSRFSRFLDTETGGFCCCAVVGSVVGSLGLIADSGLGDVCCMAGYAFALGCASIAALRAL